MLELRVLTGTHAGARALLAAEPQVIGSGDDCALILTDEGVLAQHARIEYRADGSLILQWLDDSQPPVVLRAGESACVGPVKIAVEVLGSPWDDDLPAAGATTSPTPSGQAAADPEPQPTRQVKTRQHLARLATLTGSISIAGLILAWPLAHSVLSPNAAPTAATQPATRVPAESLLPLIARLGMRDRVTVDASDPQRPGVKAMFLTGEEVETLANELSKRSPRPHLKIVDEAEAISQVVQGVQRLGSLLGATVSAQHMGGGKFRVEGQVADAAQRSQLASDLKDAFPQVAEFDIAIQVQAETARAMVEDLKREGVAQIQARWVDGMLTMDVRIPPGGVAQWEKTLQEAASRYDLPFRVRVMGPDAAAGNGSPLLPFTVRSVVSTPLPYVVLADGRKLASGGEIDGWRLVAIDPRAIRFEGPLGKQFTMER